MHNVTPAAASTGIKPGTAVSPEAAAAAAADPAAEAAAAAADEAAPAKKQPSSSFQQSATSVQHALMWVTLMNMIASF